MDLAKCCSSVDKNEPNLYMDCEILYATPMQKNLDCPEFYDGDKSNLSRWRVRINKTVVLSKLKS